MSASSESPAGKTGRVSRHLRSIIDGLSVESLIANRNELAQETRDASVQEMQKLGLVVDSLQIQDIIDPRHALGGNGHGRASSTEPKGASGP